MKPKSALHFVVLLGLVSLFADMTYEAARSISGPYLAVLGAGALTVGLVSGVGELIGYGLRIVFGVLSDRTSRYWSITIVGYAVNLLAVPLLALAGRWEVAAVLLMAERLGKAVRTPARDAMLSTATRDLGRGWAFGIHEAMDQIGAMLGPTIVAVVLAWKGSYQYGFAVLALPAVLALATLLVARRSYPHPEILEKRFEGIAPGSILPAFWIYLGAVACVAAGFVDFPLVAFHWKSASIVGDRWIPLVYAGAMGVDALVALLLGRLYDRRGIIVVQVLVVMTAWSTPLLFLTRDPWWLALGTVLWGAGMAGQESVVRAVVGELVPKDRRATGYGIFNAGYGLAWFAGSATLGMLYGWSLPAMAAFSVAIQLGAFPLLALMKRRR